MQARWWIYGFSFDTQVSIRTELHTSKLQNFPLLKTRSKSQIYSALLLQTQKTKAVCHSKEPAIFILLQPLSENSFSYTYSH